MGNEENEKDKIIDAPEGDDFHDCPKDQYLCPEYRNVPELVNIFTDISSVEFKCKEHGTIILTVKQYFEKMRNSEFTYYNFRCSNCHQIQKNILKNVKGSHCRTKIRLLMRLQRPVSIQYMA